MATKKIFKFPKYSKLRNFHKKSQKPVKMSSFQSFIPNRNRKAVYLIWVLLENRGIIKKKTYKNSKTENILNVISTSLVYNKFIASSASSVSRDIFPTTGEESLETYPKCINFRTDYISRFVGILAFSANYNPREISQNFPSGKFNLSKLSEKKYLKNENW